VRAIVRRAAIATILRLAALAALGTLGTLPAACSGTIGQNNGDDGPLADAAARDADDDAPRPDDGLPPADGAAPDGPPPADGTTANVIPPLGGSSGGSGGAAPQQCATVTAGTVQYRLIVPSGYSAATPTRLLVVFSGTEGGAQMCQNLRALAPSLGLSDVIAAVLDGVDYNGDGAAGASVLDAVRAAYNVDNDRTLLLSESAGTTAGEQLGFHLRQSWFAAYWVNDITVADAPGQTAAAIGFAPHGNAGPGGNYADAQSVVDAMRTAGYRVTDPAPYNGTGAGTHGSSEQFMAALQWFAGKSRL